MFWSKFVLNANSASATRFFGNHSIALKTRRGEDLHLTTKNPLANFANYIIGHNGPSILSPALDAQNKVHEKAAWESALTTACNVEIALEQKDQNSRAIVYF